MKPINVLKDATTVVGGAFRLNECNPEKRLIWSSWTLIVGNSLIITFGVFALSSSTAASLNREVLLGSKDVLTPPATNQATGRR